MTLVEYDEHYRQQDFFGSPYVGLMDFFERLPHRGMLCDLGAGQGRDAVPLARLGYSVTAVDISCVGLAQIAQKEPGICCVQGDFWSFPVAAFDLVFMDSILHFYKAHREREAAFVCRICRELKPGGIFATCVNKSSVAERQLKKAVNSAGIGYSVLASRYLPYPEKQKQFYLYAIQKLPQ